LKEIEGGRLKVIGKREEYALNQAAEQ